MPEGTIKRLTDRGFGFLSTGGPKDLFFHSSALVGVPTPGSTRGRSQDALQVA